MKKHIAVATFFALAGALAVAPAEPVHAQGLFERLFGPQPSNHHRERYRAYRHDDRGWRTYRDEGPVYQQPHQRQQRRAYSYADPETPRVKSPSYYTYKPDTLNRVSFASLAEVVTASSSPLEASGDPYAFIQARTHLATYSLRLLPEVGAAVKAHYNKAPHFIWVSDGRVNTRAREALAALARADRFGLAARDYAVRVPADAIRPSALDFDDRLQALAEFEIALSSAVLTYVLDATRGRIDPNRISGYHDFTRKTVDLGAALAEIAEAGDAGVYLERRNPDNAPFKALVAELARLSDKAPVARVEVAAGTFIRPDASHPELPNVIAALRLSASDALKQRHAHTLATYAGGMQFTPDLVELVRDFQREHNLHADGIIGRMTLRVLQPESGADKAEKVRIAMEQLRWLPRDLGARHVMINQPSFTASFVEEGKEPLTMRTVIGRKGNQTNFFMDKIKLVEFNPYWGVPQSIIINDMIPKLNSDPSYLDREGYEITTPSGQRVSGYQVDWYAVASRQASINVRQPPGPRNALGLVKIMFPNKHHIYMHDTPQKSLFQKDERAFSAGCVRLDNPRGMAAAVLGKPVSYIDQRIAEGRNAQEKVTADIPVYVAYFTAWPDHTGKVEYFNDVYDRDMYMTRAINATDSARLGS